MGGIDSLCASILFMLASLFNSYSLGTYGGELVGTEFLSFFVDFLFWCPFYLLNGSQSLVITLHWYYCSCWKFPWGWNDNKVINSIDVDITIINRSLAALRWYLCIFFPFDSLGPCFHLCLYRYCNCYSSLFDVVPLFIIGFFLTTSLVYSFSVFCLPSFLLQFLTSPSFTWQLFFAMHPFMSYLLWPHSFCIASFISLSYVHPKVFMNSSSSFFSQKFFLHPKSKVGNSCFRLVEVSWCWCPSSSKVQKLAYYCPFTLGVIILSSVGICFASFRIILLMWNPAQPRTAFFHSCHWLMVAVLLSFVLILYPMILLTWSSLIAPLGIKASWCSPIAYVLLSFLYSSAFFLLKLTVVFAVCVSPAVSDSITDGLGHYYH